MTNARPRKEEAGRAWRGKGCETLADASAFILTIQAVYEVVYEKAFSSSPVSWDTSC